MKKTVIDSIKSALDAMDVGPGTGVEIEFPKEEKFGDLSTPVAMSLAGTLKRAPREIAADIIKNLPDEGVFEKTEIAGPGFINFTFKKEFLHSALKSLLKDGRDFLRVDIGEGSKIQVEFVSANPTGPLHLGHGRGAALGNALSNLLDAAGYSVTREYYVNDAGRQVMMLGESVFARYKENLGVEYAFPEEGYKGEYVKDIARAAHDEAGERYRDSGFDEARDFFVDFSLGMMLGIIKEDLAKFGVAFDIWQSERELYESGGVEYAIDYLRTRDMMFESEGALWFRATSLGDEKDRVVVKSDGQPTYFASDIAYHLRKIESGYDEIINIWGADHHGYVPRLEAVIDALGYESEKLKVLLVQMVSLKRAGKPVQMSKRAGEFVTLTEVTDEVGLDTTKFIFLTRRHDSQLGFDLDVAKAQSAENPVYYVQYANARINSIFQHARESDISIEDPGDADLSLLVEKEESAIIRKLLSYPIVFEQAALSREPHRITFYLQELAGMFHPYYNRHRVVTDDPALTKARLALSDAIRIVLREGLEILGLSAPKRM
jgi:arginyl-tRNA synthetase